MLNRVWIPSPNYSSRGGAGVRLIVLHTAEGARTIESLGGYFQGNVSASSHTGADDKPNTIGEYVRRENKAWTAADYNPAAVQIELCGFAAWTTQEWDQHPNMLANAAAWIAEEAAHYGIPITRLSPAQAQGSGRGVCQHADLGAGGGGHWDCGGGFPIDRVLDMARGDTPQLPEDTMAIAAYVNANGRDQIVVHLESGVVKTLYKVTEGPGAPGWKRRENNEFAWEELGKPGK